MNTNKQYKASLFSRLFNEPSKMLEIYNALSGNALLPDTPIEPATLEDVLFMGRINDVAFVIEGKLVVLVEHQSSLNQNMPLRLLIYLSRVYEKLIHNRSVYRNRLVKIPRPEFYVLYNGMLDYPDCMTLSLSDAFMACPAAAGAPDLSSVLELKVPIININKGRNEAIMKRSAALNEYVSFVSKVQEYKTEGYRSDEAVTAAVRDCLENNILTHILSSLSSEVINLLNEEFDLKVAQEVWREEGMEEGREAGRQETRREVARNLKEAGTLSVEEIARYSGLSLNEVKKL